MKKKKFIVFVIPFILFTILSNSVFAKVPLFLIDKSILLDKIKGGWAGQTIGVSFGSYTEFKYQGTFIQDYQKIPWHEGYVKELMDSWPDLYDDIYMDLTFVDVLERVGLDAPVDSFANAFANAGYNLWHANQAARYNILHGIKQPGYWKNNPHADDIDYQIESDFSGLMNPGMPNSASKISDKVGHIMCYGDGWYGGVFVGAMYSLAFISSDIQHIVKEALTAIPQESTFYKCISDVIQWHKEFPNDWKQTWFELQKHYSEEKGCPDGVFAPLDIDAKMNAAYVVLGLLYGNGDFTKTMEISTRAGQDSDCNPSTAGGVLGTMLGYNQIPEYWMKGLKGAENKNFKYTSLCLNRLYDISYKHALGMIQSNGGIVSKDKVQIKAQKPETVRLEQCFEGLYPVIKCPLNNLDIDTLSFNFKGIGFVVRGEAVRRNFNASESIVRAKLYIDGCFAEEAEFPTDFKYRRLDLFWKYDLPNGKHNVQIVVDKNDNALLRSWEYIIYAPNQN